MLWNTCVYLEVIFNGGAEGLDNIINDILGSDTNLYKLPLPDNAQIKNKYNEYIPKRLLRKQFIEDYLDLDGLREGVKP